VATPSKKYSRKSGRCRSYQWKRIPERALLKVKLRRDQIEDWSFVRDGEPVGLFTVPVIQQIYAEKSKPSR
jgi:hypothetical protein